MWYCQNREYEFKDITATTDEYFVNEIPDLILNERQKEICIYLLNGLSQKQIAKKYNISQSRVSQILLSIRRKNTTRKIVLKQRVRKIEESWNMLIDSNKLTAKDWSIKYNLSQSSFYRIKRQFNRRF